MRALTVLGLLALVAAACEVFLDLAIGPPNPATSEYTHTAAQIGEEIGSWLFIFLTAAFGAASVALTTGRTWHRYPGLVTGTVLALIITTVSWLVGKHPM
jgi:hypothetical protein